MRFGFLPAAMLALMCSASVMAASPAPGNAPQAQQAGMEHPKGPFPHYDGPPKTRQEAIERTKARLQVLEKMSDAQWQEHRQRMEERREKFRERFKERHEGMGGHAQQGQRGNEPPAPPEEE